ncbi:MAG: biopolymer transporter ExbD [Rhodobacteraceae bacterium]|nr:biopolymer transporter ExbD [Paracoccaceae bacterium]
MPRRARPARRRTLALTSLIDVIFLLLLFFMLSSTFTRFGDLPFLAETGGPAPMPQQEPPAFLRVLPDRLVLNVGEVVLEDLRPALERAGSSVVLVAPAEGVTAQRLVDVLAAARGAAGVELRLIGG